MSPPRSTPTNLLIRVPASTANLGPGFDGLGMALRLFNEFKIVPAAGPRNSIVGRGTCAALRSVDNVFFRAFNRICATARRPAPKVHVEVLGRVPLARGLGSSATAIVAGALAANELLGGPLSREQLLLAATRVEGHPDNVAPSFLGGLTASVWTGKQVLVHKYRPHRDWRLALLIPDYELPTAKARRAIPAKIPHADAVFNLTRTPLVIDALTEGDGEELGLVLADRLHEPYRKRFIRRYEAIRRAALRSGAAAVYLSGAGPTLAALCLGEPAARRVGRAMQAAVTNARFGSQSLVLLPSPKGASIRAR